MNGLLHSKPAHLGHGCWQSTRMQKSYRQVCCCSKEGQNHYPDYWTLTEKSVACLLALPEETLPRMQISPKSHLTKTQASII